MSCVSSVGRTGLAYVDGLLSGVRWTQATLSYSMPVSAAAYGYAGEPDYGFASVTPAQAVAVKKMLGQVAAVTNLNFAASASAATAELRFAKTSMTSTAWAYEPSDFAEAGDVWFNASSSWFTKPVAGSYGYFALLHEVGHALGLKHAHEAGMFGAAPASRASMEYTIMSYASYIGGSTAKGYTNEAAGYAQSLMMDDIAALQALYGADYTANAGNTVYRFNPLTGEASINGVGQGAPAANRVFQTIWDGGGNDTFDFSNYTTNLIINLAPGSWSTLSRSQLADLSGDGTRLARGNVATAHLNKNDPRGLIENAKGGSGADVLSGNAASNNLTGGAGNDTLSGGAGNDILHGGPGADRLLGGDGFDTISYAGAAEAIALSLAGGGTRGQALGDSFSSIERVIGSAFADQIVGSAGADVLLGMAGNDVILAGAGNDTLIGGAGFDRLAGGAGADAFVFQALSDAGDSILDFVSGADRILLAATLTGGRLMKGFLQPESFELGSRATLSGAEIFFDAARDTLFWDSDGRGIAAAQALATFTPEAILKASDILII